MGWLKRLFGMEKPQNAEINPAPQSIAADNISTNVATQSIPPERVGLSGEYDQSGLAKRVALAFDQDPQLDDVNTLWVAQTGSTVVLKGKVPSQEILNKMVSVARTVNGATNVDSTQATIG
ncbi:BON domain-containing protein [Nostoc sp. UHCC 0252]|uniref:BON domain-containing protein n=1 Tax=Nostoc sp. UHCC 0252 TaxID=3110241 RepID=UPI002B20D79A|nr:BON domain-containing protein [Nostoc sp. UHCC 0252]MEA5602170.1 BON domain-containing protein [Nostoc sp. UHCC 0252]